MNYETNLIYENLKKQINTIFKDCKQASIKTTERYQHGVEHFAKFLAETYKEEDITSVSNEHIESYVKQMQKTGYSVGYIATNISSIRCFVSQLNDFICIKSNYDLGLPRRILS